MRYVSVGDLTKKMVLAKPLFGPRGELMLEKGIALTDDLIGRIDKLQYSGLYVEDALSEGIEVKDVISDEVRINTMKAIRRLMMNVEFNRGVHDDLAKISRLLERIIDEIMSSDSLVFNIIDMKQFDLYTYQHSVNVCVLSCIIGKVYGLPRKRLMDIALAAILHDIGKVCIDKTVLNKPGKFTPEEFEIIKQHSMLGYEWAKQKCRLSSIVAKPILQHHEKFDGSGYPFGKKAEEISLFAQIISIADVYDAITSKRPYHEPILPSEAYELILGSSSKSFSWELVDIFTKKIAPFPLGILVQLSNGEKGIVYKNYDDCLMRPLIKLCRDMDTREEERYIDLKNDTAAYNITIQKVFT